MEIEVEGGAAGEEEGVRMPGPGLGPGDAPAGWEMPGG